MKRGPVHIVPQPPASMRHTANGRIQLDFGKVAFGNLRVHWPPGFGGIAVVHFGEALAKGGVDRTPPGAVRYARVEAAAAQGSVVAPRPMRKTPVRLPSPRQRNGGKGPGKEKRKCPRLKE